MPGTNCATTCFDLLFHCLLNITPCSFLSFACSDFAENVYLNNYWSKHCKETCSELQGQHQMQFLTGLDASTQLQNCGFGWKLSSVLQLSKLEKEIHLFVGTNVRHTSICPLSQWYKKCKNLHYGLCVWKEMIISIQSILGREKREIASIGCSSF